MSDKDPLLFCPFCRECFEGETTCPAHDLPLVELHKLPKSEEDEDLPRYDEAVSPLDPRFGRGLVVAGAIGLLASFFLPMVSALGDGQERVWSAFDMASNRAPNLWTIPFVGALCVAFVLRRRTPLQMRGARLGMLFVSACAVLSMTYSLAQVFRGAAERHVEVSLSLGVAGVLLSTLILVVGSLRFGVLPTDRAAHREAEPHGARGEESQSDKGPRIESDGSERKKKPARRKRGKSNKKPKK